MTQDLTTLICLFHHKDQAQAALEEILQAGIPEANVTLIGAAGSNISATRSTLAELNVPEKDIDHLLQGMGTEGAILSVSAISDLADKVESIFSAHQADKIDEAVVADDMSDRALLQESPTNGTYSAEMDALAAAPLAGYPAPNSPGVTSDPLLDPSLVESPALSELPTAQAFPVMDRSTLTTDSGARVLLYRRIVVIPVEDISADLENSKDSQDPTAL